MCAAGASLGARPLHLQLHLIAILHNIQRAEANSKNKKQIATQWSTMEMKADDDDDDDDDNDGVISYQVLSSTLVGIFHRQADLALFQRDHFDPDGLANGQTFLHVVDARQRYLSLNKASHRNIHHLHNKFSKKDLKIEIHALCTRPCLRNPSISMNAPNASILWTRPRWTEYSCGGASST
jgi:hypothetical protein